MEFFHLLKASQKSGQKDAVIWFTAKSEARAALQLDVDLEEAGIETGRGKDYAKPIRTDMPVCNDLPEEGTVDYSWCERYELQDDARTWLPKAAGTVEAPAPADVKATVDVEPVAETVSLENRNPAVRFAVHLSSNKYQTHISKEQQLAASELSLEEGNTYLHSLLAAKNDIPEIAELTLHAEWKLIQAIKEVFHQDKTHDVSLIAEFMAAWASIEPEARAGLVEDWLSGKLPALKTEIACSEDVITGHEPTDNDGIKLDEHDDATTRYPVVQMPFRKQLLAQFNGDELRHHLTREEFEALGVLEMDTDNSYVQNLLLAAESCPEVKGYDTKDLWRYTEVVRKVFSQDKRHELALVLRFTKIWVTNDYIDRGILAREWAAGNRISNVQRTDSGTNAGGGIDTDRNPGYTHTLDTLDSEIALATLPEDFNIYDIPGAVYRRAKEIVAAKESPFKEWSSALRNAPGILDYSRASIFALIRSAHPEYYKNPGRLSGYINANLTESDHGNPTEEVLAAARHTPEVSWDSEVNEHVEAEKAAASQPQVENLGGGVFSIAGLLSGNENPVTNIPSNEVEKAEIVTETTSDVQMEAAQPEKVEVTDAVSPGESADAADPEAVAVAPADILAAAAPSLANQDQENVNQKPESVSQNSDSVNQNAPETVENEPDVQQDEPATEYPAYFEPGRYEGLPNDVYHESNGISSTQVKDARVSLMYFNARHVAKTIPRVPSKVLDMGNLVHALALQPELLDAEFSVEPVIPGGAFTTAATLREFIDTHNASLPALLSADDIKALLEEHNATLPAQVPLGDDVTQTGENYMALPAEFQRVEEGQKPTAAKMKACIKEYNSTLPAQMKTSGSRDALLEQLAIINPELVAQEAQKPVPLKVSGTKADMIQSVKSVNPDAVFADELLDAWRENPGDKILVTRQQLATALDIQSALLAHPTAGMLLQHPNRAVEVSYFGFDEETGLEVRVRPDLEIDLDNLRIGADLKTISMWNVKQESLRARLHREIIERDYHLSAAMYCETAGLDQFFWIFVNKDENYHWIAIIEASAELLELGILEYRKSMRTIATGFDTGEWPAPITADYTDELNDFDLRRLEALRLA